MATENGQNLPTCDNCGADIRENTAFCYRCGVQVRSTAEAAVEPDISPEAAEPEAAPEMDVTTRSALDDLAERLRDEKKDEAHLAKAADKRRRARIAQRKPKPPVWEPEEGSPALLLLLVTAVVFVVAVFVVYFTTIAK